MVRHHETDAPNRARAAQAVAPHRGPAPSKAGRGVVEVSLRFALERKEQNKEPALLLFMGPLDDVEAATELA